VNLHPLAILLVFRNDKDLAEKILTIIYSNLNEGYKLYIVDDASDDDTAQTIQSVIGHFSHEQSFFYENKTELGRDKSIQELMQLIESPFIWMPLTVDSDSSDLKALNELLKTSNDSSDTADLNTSGNDLNEKQIIGDDDFSEPDFEGVVGKVRPMRNRPVSTEPEKKLKEPLKFRPTFRTNSIELAADASPIAIEVFEKVQKFVHDGENLFALNAIDAVQAKHPNDTGLIKLKIKVLEFMRRYVEAAELKHQLKLGGPGVARPKVRRESIVVVDPTEDVEGAFVVDRQEHMNTASITSDIVVDDNTNITEDVKQEIESDIDIDIEDMISEFIKREAAEEEAAKITEELPLVRPKSYSKKPRISVIIPTTIDGKALLERTIISLSTKADKEDRELIIVDNASLDDTYEYLNQLKRENFMQIRVITNAENFGFARAVNQAMAIARGDYLLIMHNDVTIDTDVPGKLADLMDVHLEVTTLGPLTKVTWCDEQRRKSVDPDEMAIRKNRVIDSFCMMLRKSKALKFDERYGLAHFDDMDYCLEDAKNGGVIAIATGIKVNHLGGSTTSVIGRESYSRPYWKNASEFETKWDALPQLAPFTEDDMEIEKLTMISELLNPFYPEGHLIDLANQIMTSEVRNDIIKGKYTVSQHVALIRLMMILDMRDLARLLEDKLDPHEFDETLVQQLIDFYYQKNIYSRSLKYLEKIDHSKKPFSFKLIELKVYMGAREIDKASNLLTELIREVPTHPDLFKITSDIHKLQGNRSEADQFYAMAHQTDPYTYR
jgi:GT2 family glycosyltransferase